MKKAYVLPKITIEQFAPNEYVAACAEAFDGTGLIICDGSGQHGGKVGWHGFIADAEDVEIMYRYQKKAKFNILACGFVDPVTGYVCDQNIDETQDIDPFGSNTPKSMLPKDVTTDDCYWIHIEFTGQLHDDEALFRTIGSGIPGGGYQDYNAAS